MSTFDEDLFLKGLEQRKATLGAAYVEKNLAAADDFTRPFQEAMTAWCWGFGWGDDVIDAKTRSMMNLSMIGALGKMSEWEIHCRGAITNGVSQDEIRAIIHSPEVWMSRPLTTGAGSNAHCAPTAQRGRAAAARANASIPDQSPACTMSLGATQDPPAQITLGRFR